MARYTRKDWGAKPSNDGQVKLEATNLEGMAIHWPAMSKKLNTVAQVMAALRSWQAYHQSKGWRDIAYQEAVDQMGNSYVLRGLTNESAANGDEDTNDEWGALLLILAPGETPSAAMMKTARRRIKRFREIYPRAVKIRGHSEIRPEPTACPGPIVMKMIKDGDFRTVELVKLRAK